ncbi:MAG TPA: DUF523 domain-containing protein [Anaerolineales bacterium]|nr:DUF523 domain-containing protein [Anaerolineales bacterium]
MIIVSSCLAGCHCRYDGDSKPNEKVINLVADGKALPVCPEQLGGLPTPRLPAEQRGNKVYRNDGVDVTYEFEKGAREALRLAKLVNARKAILKARSPSCGSGEIYDGSFNGVLIKGNGTFAEMCKKEGIIVRTEEEI